MVADGWLQGGLLCPFCSVLSIGAKRRWGWRPFFSLLFFLDDEGVGFDRGGSGQFCESERASDSGLDTPFISSPLLDIAGIYQRLVWGDAYGGRVHD